jgi:cobalt/nickel transport system permease protein
MHIPDGYLGPATYGSAWAVMVPIWGYASRKVKATVKTHQVPYLAMGTVFSLLAMMFMVPVPGGTTGHISGAAVVAILLGPWAGVLAVSVSLFIQGLVFGDGGITAIGANCFNIAVAGGLTGWGIYSVIVRAGTKFRKGAGGPAENLPVPSLALRLAAGAAASYLAINLGALLAAIELGIQPLIHSASRGGAVYFPYPPSISIPAVMLPHLTTVGALEAGVTVLVLGFFHKTEGNMGESAKIAVSTLLCLASLLAGAAVCAHDYWIEKSGNGYTVVYGHGDKRTEYDPANVKRLTVYDKAGKPVEFRKEVQGKVLTVYPSGPASLIVADLDSGYWSKTIYGWKNLPKRKASRVVEAVRTFHYSKSVVSWGDTAGRPVDGMRLDIIPLKNPFDLRGGETVPVKVLYDGKPLAGATVEGDHEKVASTDNDGITKVPLKKGRNLLTVERKEPLSGDPDADSVSITTTLTFEVAK